MAICGDGATVTRIGNGDLWLGDCLDFMRSIPDGSVDMVLCDLPYGTTACKWDQVIPFEPLWEQYWRVCKPNAAVVLTASQPFTSIVVISQINYFKHEWIWRKNQGVNPMNAKFQPLKNHESIIIFAKKTPLYNPQMWYSTPYSGFTTKSDKKLGSVYSEGYSHHRSKHKDNPTGERFPLSVQDFTMEKKGFHPTQKPVALFEYLIRTYTNPGDLVLDNCAGSGTTAIAAQQSDRRWLCIERDPEYYIKAMHRIATACR